MPLSYLTILCFSFQEQSQFEVRDQDGNPVDRNGGQDKESGTPITLDASEYLTPDGQDYVYKKSNRYPYGHGKK